MPKMKTKSGAKKRFKVTGSGKVKAKSAFARHMQMNKPKSMKRKARGGMKFWRGRASHLLLKWLMWTRAICLMKVGWIMCGGLPA